VNVCVNGHVHDAQVLPKILPKASSLNLIDKVRKNVSNEASLVSVIAGCASPTTRFKP